MISDMDAIPCNLLIWAIAIELILLAKCLVLWNDLVTERVGERDQDDHQRKFRMWKHAAIGWPLGTLMMTLLVISRS